MTEQNQDSERKIRLGSTVIVFDGKSFIFQHAHEAHKVVSIDDADVTDLVKFLDQTSNRSRTQIQAENDTKDQS